jgi:hypothetical protein
MRITTIGLDLAKSWFQVHGIDADGRVVVRRRLCGERFGQPSNAHAVAERPTRFQLMFIAR